MKTLPITRPILALLFACLPLRAEDEIEKAFRDALYAEEVKGDTEAALKAYQEVAAKFEQQRDMAATALFRQAECLRKLGRKDEAAALYNKVLAQYGDKERTAKLSRENLAALGMAPAAGGDTSAVATDTGEVARLEKLLKDSPDLINATDASNPLAAAAEKGQVALVDYLLGKGARVDTLVDGKSALHRAAEAGHLTVCQKLIEKGADVNLKSSSEATPLILALDKGRFSIAELLLDKKADANAGKLRNATPAKYENQGQQHVLTQAAWSETHYTLSLALVRDAPDSLVLRLIAAGAGVAAAMEHKANDSVAKTAPLAFAIRGRRVEVMSAILEKGFSPVQEVEGKEDAIALAMRHAKPTAPEATDDPVVELLRKHGCRLKQDTVMLTAVRFGLTGYIRAAVKDGAGVHRLVEAVEAKQPASVKTLLELGADPALVVNEYGTDAMITAAGAADMATMTLLREAGYPVKERLAKLVKTAAWGVFSRHRKGPVSPEVQKVYESLAAEAKEAGLLEDGLTAALEESFGAYPPYLNVGELIAQGANTAKSPRARALLQDERNRYGVRLDDYPQLWKAVRITQNEELKSAVWISRGPSVAALKSFDASFPSVFQQAGYQHYRPFFRAVISEKGIVPPGTIGRLIAAQALNPNENDLTQLTVYRLNADQKLLETKVDFISIAKAGDAAKDFALQWGDVVEIPPLPTVQPGSDSQADAAMAAQQAAVSNFIAAFYSDTDISFSIGTDQIISNADNGQEPVLRMFSKIDALVAANLPSAVQPAPAFARMAAGDPDFQPLTINGPHEFSAMHGLTGGTLASLFHGDRLRIVPPLREAALNDAALRRAVTFAESESGPYLRTTWGGLDKIAEYPGVEHGPGGITTVRRLRDVLLMLHGPNLYGFGPVDWSAAELRIAGKHGWEAKAMSEVNLDDAVLPGMMFILPRLDPSKPVPADDFAYADCAMEVEVTPGDLPPFKLRFQPPVPKLKRSGSQWVWSWTPKDGDSPCAWPDLHRLLSNSPEIKAWPSYKGEITLKSGRTVEFDKNMLTGNGGIWLQPDWKGIRLERKDPPRPGQALPAGVPIQGGFPNNTIPQPGIPQPSPAVLPNGRSVVRPGPNQ